MRTKEDIVTDLKRTKQTQFATYHNGPPPDVLSLEVLIDIRDILYDLSQSIGSNIIDLARES